MALWSRFFPVRRMLFFAIIDNRRWDLRGSVAVKLRVKRCIDVQETFTRDLESRASKWKREPKTSAVAAMGDLGPFR